MNGSPTLQGNDNMPGPHIQPVLNGVKERCATATTSFEFDGDISNDIAICGFSIKFPQEATSASAFWDMILERRCAMTESPAERLSLEGFHGNKNKLNTVNCLTSRPFHVRGNSAKEDIVATTRREFPQG
jgi:hypothetical protein